MNVRKPYRDTRDVASAVARLVKATGKRVATEDPEDLRQLQLIEDALAIAWSTAIEGLRATGYSDTAIGAELGVTKQAIAKRWPRQEGAL